MEDGFIPGVDWWVARYHGVEISNSQEGMPIAVERARDQALRVAFNRALLYASSEGGELTFHIADGKGESGDAVRELKAHIDAAFAALGRKSAK